MNIDKKVKTKGNNICKKLLITFKANEPNVKRITVSKYDNHLIVCQNVKTSLVNYYKKHLNKGDI